MEAGFEELRGKKTGLVRAVVRASLSQEAPVSRVTHCFQWVRQPELAAAPPAQVPIGCNAGSWGEALGQAVRKAHQKHRGHRQQVVHSVQALRSQCFSKDRAQGVAVVGLMEMGKAFGTEQLHDQNRYGRPHRREAGLPEVEEEEEGMMTMLRK